MLEETFSEPRRKGSVLTDAAREDLEIYGVSELAERIELLEAEITRVKAQIERKKSGLSAAEALFSFPKS